MHRNAILVGTLIGSMLASPVLAASGNVCLQRNRVVSWRAVDENTIVYTDRQMNQYTVTLRDRCSPLTQSTAVLVYRNWASLSCLQSNDAIRVKATGRALTTCRVATVQAGAPTQAPG
jgi:uncharacterized protein DUF6491